MTPSAEAKNHTPYIIITYPYPLGQANGGARMTREIARHLGRAGARVTIVSVSAPARLQYPRSAVDHRYLGHEFDDDLASEHVDVLRVAPNLFHWSLDGLPVYRRVKKILKHQEVDLVLSYYHEAAFLPSLLKSKKIKFGFIATWISYQLALNRPIKKKFLRETLRTWIDKRFILKPHKRADLIFATSKFTRDELINIMNLEPARIIVCPLGVSAAFLKIPREKPGAISRFLFFGRVVRIKGIEDCINALSLIKERGFRDWKFRIFGPGNHDWAQNLVRTQCLEDNVEIFDEIGDEDLYRELQEAELAFMPSHVEAFGLSLAEAQAAGLPIIAYDVGSVPEIVESGKTGWLAPFRQIERLAELLESAILSPESAFQAGLAGRERIARGYSWDNTAEIILAQLK